MAIPNRESYPTPPPQEKVIDTSGDRYMTPAFVMSGWAKEADPIIEKIYDDFNKEHGTSIEYQPIR